MITKWLHVHEVDRDPFVNTWLLPILAAINDGVKKGICTGIHNEASELGMHISTRINFLPLIIERININSKNLYDEIKNYEEKHIFENGKDAYAKNVKSKILNHLLIDIDSFLFETNSCCELMKLFLGEIYKHRRRKHYEKNELGKILKKLLIEKGQDPNWFSLLDKERNFFIHKGAPYVTIDISTSYPELIITKENIKSFNSINDPKKFTKLSELNSIVKGFFDAAEIVREHIKMLYN